MQYGSFTPVFRGFPWSTPHSMGIRRSKNRFCTVNISFQFPRWFLGVLFFQISSIFFCTNYVWQLILVLSFSRAPVGAAYNMFSPVNIFVHKNFPISFLKLRIAGQSAVRYSFSSVIIRTQRTGTIPMPSFRVSRHLYAIKLKCTSVRQN